jgi:hypothetical protein
MGLNPRPTAGRPRRSIKIASIPLNQWDVEVRLERFKPAGGPAVWLFSPSTVEKIIPLYQVYGPGPLVQYLPATLRMHLFNGDPFWQGAILLVSAVLAAGLGLLVERGLSFLFQRFGTPLPESLRPAHRVPRRCCCPPSSSTTSRARSCLCPGRYSGSSNRLSRSS